MKYQTEVYRLASQVWGDKQETGNDLIARLCEEVGELAQAIRKYEEGVRFGHQEKPGTKETIEDELADVMFMVGRISNAYSLDLDRVMERSIAKIEGRIMRADDQEVLETHDEQV